MNELIGDFQLHLMQQRFLTMDAEDAAWVRGETIHSWAWGIMKQIHKMTYPARNALHLHMVGDYKMYSLNPTGRHNPTYVQNMGTPPSLPQTQSQTSNSTGHDNYTLHKCNAKKQEYMQHIRTALHETADPLPVRHDDGVFWQSERPRE